MVTSISIFLVFILWAGTLVSSNVTWQNTTFPEPLQWSNTLPFQTFPIVSDASNSLDLIFSSAPLLRHRKVTKQRQLKVFSQNIDLTSVALKVHNRRRDISLLLENHVRLASVFIPAYRSKQEYLLESRPMSYHDCSTFCADFSSVIFHNMDMLIDILTLFSDFHGHFWIKSFQTEQLVDNYGGIYSLAINNGKNKTEIFPFSQYNNQSTQCFFLQNFELQPCVGKGNLGSETSYFEMRAEKHLYYNQHPFSLKAQLVIPLAPKHRNGSLYTWYTENIYFQTFIPRSSHLKSHHKELAQCMCVRPQNVTLIQQEKANTQLSQAFLSFEELSFGIERPRVRGHSHEHLSTVPHILADMPNEKFRPEVDHYLNENIIFPLFVNSTDWQVASNTSNGTNLFETLPLHRSASPRTSPVTAAAAMGLLKIASIGVPFLIDQVGPVWAKLSERHSGYFVKPDLSRDKMIDSKHFQSYLDETFKDNAVKFQVLNDRIKVFSHTKYFKPDQVLNQAQVISFQHEAQALSALQSQLFAELPNLLISRLVTEVSHKIDPNSEIYVEILKAKSFISYRFYYLELVESSSVTTFQFYVFPHIQRKNSWQYYYVQNVSINMADSFHLSSQRAKEFLCQKAVLGTEISSLEEVCSTVTRVPPLLEKAIIIQNGYTLFVRGNGVLHYSCVGKPASMFVMKDEFILFLVNDACSVHAVFQNSIQFHLPSTSHKPGDFEVFPLLQYSISVYATREEKVDFFLWFIGIIFVILLCFILILVCACLYYKKRLGLRIARANTENHPIELQFVDRFASTPEQALPFSPPPGHVESKLAPNQVLPSEGGPIAENVFQKVFKANLCRSPQIVDSEVTFYRQTFPYMHRSNSTSRSSSTVTYDSGLVLTPRQKPDHLCLTPRCKRQCDLRSKNPFLNSTEI